MSSALVMFSGGQDSATCLAWALDRYDAVETIGFDYGQRHKVELECRNVFIDELRAMFPAWNRKLGQDHLLDLGLLGEVSDTALTADRRIEFAESGLPNTFVPGRNLLFFTLAGAIAFRRGQKALVGGMCETDYSGYPDCRDDTLKALQVALNLGLDSRFVIETPPDVDRQGPNLGIGRATGRGFASRTHPRQNPHMLRGQSRYPPRLGLRMRILSGLRTQARRL